MKAIYAFAIVLAASFCQPQNINAYQRTPDDAYTRQLVHLITGLQRNPWLGWESGTEVVVRYLIDTNEAGKPLGHAQPDLVYKVEEADRVLIVTQVVNNRPTRRDFMIKDQPGLDAAWPRIVEPKTTELEIDGFTVTGFLSVLTVSEFPGGTRVTKEWTLASHPSVVLRKEASGDTVWGVTSARVIKKIGERKFPCVEIRKTMRVYYDGANDVVTTQYLSPEVPGHLVEEIQEFFKVKKGQRSSTPFQVVHQKVVELRLPRPAREEARP